MPWQVAAWIALWGFWVFVSRHNHPNLGINAIATALVVVMASLALACAAAIRLVYDALWGPDPLRFGFWANFGMELTGVAIHVIAVAVGVRSFGRVARIRGRIE